MVTKKATYRAIYYFIASMIILLLADISLLWAMTQAPNPIYTIILLIGFVVFGLMIGFSVRTLIEGIDEEFVYANGKWIYIGDIVNDNPHWKENCI